MANPDADITRFYFHKGDTDQAKVGAEFKAWAN